MNDPATGAKPPISDYRLRAIVKCIETIDGNLGHHTIDSPYGKLVRACEDFLLAGDKDDSCRSHGLTDLAESWRVAALADLAAGCWNCFPPGRATRYLFAAAEDGYVPAQCELVRKGMEKDLDPPHLNATVESPGLTMDELERFNRVQVARWLPIAAEAGAVDAQCILGMELVASDDPGEFAKGAHWLNLAILHTPGRGTAFDDELARAKFVLAYLMELGRVEPISDQQMFLLYESAAKGGVPEAMLAVGHYLEHGIGVERDVEPAVDWYRSAGEFGCECGYLLAYSVGRHARDVTKAASLGDMSAMLRLAKEKLDAACQFRSPWGENDYERESFESALFWYDCASENGSLEATLLLAEIHDGSWHTTPPESWSCQSSTGDRLARALEYYERAGVLGWKFAAQKVERIQKQLDQID